MSDDYTIANIEITCSICSDYDPKCRECEEYLTSDTLFLCEEEGHICRDCRETQIEEEKAKKELGR